MSDNTLFDVMLAELIKSTEEMDDNNSGNFFEEIEDIAQKHIKTLGGNPVETEVAVDNFLEQLKDNMSRGEPLDRALDNALPRLNLMMAREQIESDEQQSDIEQALVSGENIEEVISDILPEGVSPDDDIAKTMVEHLQNSLTEGAYPEKALLDTKKILDQTLILNDTLQEESDPGDHILRAISNGEDVAGVMKRYFGDLSPDALQKALDGFTTALNHGQSPDAALKSVEATLQASITASEAVQGEMSSEASLLSSIASGENIETTLSEMQGKGGDADAFQETLSAAIANGNGIEAAVAQAAATTATVVESNAAVTAGESDPEMGLLNALSSGENTTETVDTAMEALVESGAVDANNINTESFQEALAESLEAGSESTSTESSDSPSGETAGNSIQEALTQAVQSTTALAEIKAAVQSTELGSEGALLSALSSGENVADTVDAIMGNSEQPLSPEESGNRTTPETIAAMDTESFGEALVESMEQGGDIGDAISSANQELAAASREALKIEGTSPIEAAAETPLSEKQPCPDGHNE